MLGMLYKELKINLKWLLTTLFTLSFMNAALSVAMIVGNDDAVNSEVSMVTKFMFFFLGVISFTITGTISLNFMQTDERKKWGYYISAIKDGIKLQVAAKYLVVLINLMMTFVICFLVNYVCHRISADVMRTDSFLLIMLCISLILRSIELPFIVSFGSKSGSMIKGSVMAGVMFIAVIYLLFGDISWIGSEDQIWDSFFRFIGRLDLKEVIRSWTGKVLLAGIPLYILSYYISTKLYLKGIDRLES